MKTNKSIKTKPQDNLFNLTFKNEIPLLCAFELTSSCNLNCVHCYLSGRNSDDCLSTYQVKRVLEQLAKAGTLYLVFTGGEIFLRKDIFELCSYARKLKFDLRLFTNATLIDEATVNRLSHLDLSGIEISLYGRKNTHDAITRSKGSFDKTITAIKLLKAHKIPVSIKCPVIKQNFKDMGWLKTFAKKLDIKFRLDPTISAKDNNDKSALKHRLNTKDLEHLIATMSPKLHKTKDPLEIFDERFLCSAGKNMIGIGFDGTLFPCLGWKFGLGDIVSKSFDCIWKGEEIKRIRSLELKDIRKCSSCEIRCFCQRCPGMAMTEEGNFNLPSKIACKIANISKNLILA
jgi:radical SAM protein with 4Fe4S-binding SPASM domain